MSLLNKSETRKYILQKFEHMRPHLGITRIADSTICTLEARLKNMIIDQIKKCPSKGKTFKI